MMKNSRIFKLIIVYVIDSWSYVHALSISITTRSARDALACVAKETYYWLYMRTGATSVTVGLYYINQIVRSRLTRRRCACMKVRGCRSPWQSTKYTSIVRGPIMLLRHHVGVGLYLYPTVYTCSISPSVRLSVGLFANHNGIWQRVRLFVCPSVCRSVNRQIIRHGVRHNAKWLTDVDSSPTHECRLRSRLLYA